METPSKTLRRLLKVRKVLGRDLRDSWALPGWAGIEQRIIESYIETDVRRAQAENEEVYYDYQAKQISDLKI